MSQFHLWPEFSMQRAHIRPLDAQQSRARIREPFGKRPAEVIRHFPLQLHAMQNRKRQSRPHAKQIRIRLRYSEIISIHPTCKCSVSCAVAFCANNNASPAMAMPNMLFTRFITHSLELAYRRAGAGHNEAGRGSLPTNPSMPIFLCALSKNTAALPATSHEKYLSLTQPFTRPSTFLYIPFFISSFSGNYHPFP